MNLKHGIFLAIRLAIRLALTAALLVMVYRETGPWTTVAFVLAGIGWEISVLMHRLTTKSLTLLGEWMELDKAAQKAKEILKKESGAL